MSSLRSLVWELWHRSRWVVLASIPWIVGICVVLILLLNYRLASYRVDGNVFSGLRGTLNSRTYGLVGSGLRDMAISGMFVGLLVPMCTIVLSYSGPDALELSVPRRIQRLPVASWKIVLTLMLFGMTVMGLIAAMMASASSVFFPRLSMPLWGPVVLVMLAMAALQAWAFTLRSNSGKTTALSFVMYFGLIGFLVSLHPVSAFFAGLPPAVAGVVVLGLFYAIAVTGFSINRRSDAQALQKGEGSSVRTIASFGPKFNSPRQAQLWYEWRRYGWHLPACLITSLVLYFIGFPLLTGLFTGSWETSKPNLYAGLPQKYLPEGTTNEPTLFVVDWVTSPEIISWGLVIAVIVSALVVGAIRHFTSANETSRSTFLYTRPMSTRALAFARLSMAFKSTGLAVGILAVAFALFAFVQRDLVAYWANENMFTSGHSVLPEGYFLGLCVLASFTLMWMAVWSMNAGWVSAIFALTYIPAFALLWLFSMSGLLSSDRSLYLVGLTSKACGWLASILIVIGFLYVFWRSMASGFTYRRAVLLSLLFWPVYTGAFFYYQYAENMGYFEEHSSLLGLWQNGQSMINLTNAAIWIALSLIPIAPAFTHPFFLDRARHH